MSGRSQQILSRFPAHLEAGRAGKLLGEVVERLAIDLDGLASALAAVRRAHRLGDADELADLLLIAARHGIGRAELEILFARFGQARRLADALAAAADAAARDDLAERLTDLWGLDAARPRLTLFAPAGGADLAAAAPRLVAQAREALRHGRLVDAVRRRVERACAIHAAGNGTVQALLEGAANALDLDLGEVVHSADRYWHAATVRDRLALARQVAAPGPGGEPQEETVAIPPAAELLGIEENPLWRAETDNAPRHHAELFTLLRRGFERALLQIRVTGEGARSIGPMLVNRDEGHGVGYAGTVEAGKTLVFTEEGRALLDGADVTSFAYAWQGACFAGEDASAEADFVFAGEGVDPRRKPARFALATPAGALDREASFPSAGASLPMPGIAVGQTRLAFFVREGHFASQEGAQARGVTPRIFAAEFDGAVFAPASGEARPDAARVALSWLEHRAFAVRLLIPPRFRALRDDDPEGVQALQAVARAVERFRPLGVELRVEFIDERWVLGSGTLTSGEGDDPIESLRSGMVLWEAPQEPANA